jgi:hypothetical protein
LRRVGALVVGMHPETNPNLIGRGGPRARVSGSHGRPEASCQPEPYLPGPLLTLDSRGLTHGPWLWFLESILEPARTSQGNEGLREGVAGIDRYGAPTC